MADDRSKPGRKRAAPVAPDRGRPVSDSADALAGDLSGDFRELSAVLLAAAEEFSSDARPIGSLMTAMAGDVERAARERLEIIPVAHHCPASAIHVIQRLRARPPRIVFIEMCEDLLAPVPDLADSSLPIALQAFAGASTAFPEAWAPLSVIAPLTELSAEYQAIAFALQTPGTELVFVDRSVDHVYQALPRDEDPDDAPGDHPPDARDADDADDTDEARLLHGSAIGVELGSLIPSFDDFLEFLLANARVNHFAEWWSLYVEQPTIGASYETYRRILFLVGSLIRRLGSTRRNLDMDRMRERYMWTRMKQRLRETGLSPGDAVYICGAAHAASEVEEFGTDRFGTPDDALWDIPPRTDTEWLYGLIPSSYSAIEHQFSHPRGTISLAAQTWKKAMTALKVKPFRLASTKSRGKKSTSGTSAARKSSARKSAARKSAGAPASAPIDAAAARDELLAMLTTPPSLVEQDQEQLLAWCIDIVGLARKNHYLASTADCIAIYQTSMLLANLRSRRHPSPNDFIDAAITCLEKTRVPGKRSVARLCEILLGADKIGMVGYSSLPPLVQDVYDRLARLGVTPKKTTITRSLMDFASEPGLRACSDLLWRLHYLLPGTRVARPIVGKRELGLKAPQESWDIKLGGAEQRAVIQLAYEGVTIEQVLEKRLQRSALAPGATTVGLLEVAEVSIVLLDNPRLTEDVGERAVHRLASGVGSDDAQDVFERIRRLVHHYRATPGGLPHWLEDFVATGYQHYASSLPEAFSDRGTRPEQVAGMLAFVFTLESLALTLGCNRSQLVIAVGQAGDVTDDPNKLGLLWAAEWLLDLRDDRSLRREFDAILANPMSVSAYPLYLGGFLLALGFTAMVAPLGVELLSRAFSELPDAILMPWLPGLIDTLRPRAHDIMPALLKEARIALPDRLAELDAWSPPWQPGAGPDQPEPAAAPTAAPVERSADEQAARDLLAGHPAAIEAHAARLGLDPRWQPDTPDAPDAARASPASSSAASPAEASIRALLLDHGHATRAHAEQLDAPGE